MTTATPRTTPRKKMNLYFTVEFRRCLDLLNTSIGLRPCSSLICNASIQFQIKIRKIGGRRSRSPKDPELGHFTLLFLQRTAKKCKKNYNARAQLLFCSLNLLFCGVLVAFAVVVCLRSLIDQGLSWKQIFCRRVSSLSVMFSLEVDLSEKREKLDLSGYQSDYYTMLQRNTCGVNACYKIPPYFPPWPLGLASMQLPVMG